MFKEIEKDLQERFSVQPDSRCASPDEVRLAWLLIEVERLRRVVDEVHSWAVCSAIAPPNDMAQSFPRIVEITAPEYDGHCYPGALLPGEVLTPAARQGGWHSIQQCLDAGHTLEMMRFNGTISVPPPAGA